VDLVETPLIHLGRLSKSVRDRLSWTPTADVEASLVDVGIDPPCDVADVANRAVLIDLDCAGGRMRGQELDQPGTLFKRGGYVL
jgi:hypothetical protein